ncbi:MAG TPA: hypothetical protein VE031_04570 [Chthoniobacterales bacterium]|nr:hypothetical protein [Chthoniobacterales bacterium]
MTAPDNSVLWREVLAEEEPWRRGRLFLILIACVTFLFQALVLGYGIITGLIEFVLVHALASVIFWLQFYLIWIGIHWLRWLNGGWNALCGFALLIWALRDRAPVPAVLGAYLLMIGCYMGFAPSVYFFAKRQKEKVRWMESLAIAGVFLLLLGAVYAGVLGLAGYKAGLERQAREFANTAFRRLFAQHDTYYLLDHVTDQVLSEPHGRDRLTRFLQGTTMQAGDVRDIEPAVGSVRFWYSFPFDLASEAQMTTHARAERGSNIGMQLVLIEAHGDWKIQYVRWYPDYDRRSASPH